MTGHALPKPSPRWAIAALALSTLLASLGTSIANVALPTLMEAFGATFQQVQWVVLAYLLTITVMSVGAGRLGDILGHRRVLLAGIALFALASLVCGLAGSLAVLIAARAVQGLGAAMLMALSVALVGASVPRERTGSVMGLFGTMSAIGTTLGPSLGGALLAGAGWQALFLALAPLGIANFVLVRFFVPADNAKPGVPRPAFDTAGTLVLAVTIAAYALAMTLNRGGFGALNATLLGLAFCGAAAFAFVEAKAASPLFRLSTLRDPSFSAGLVMNAIVAAVMMANLVVGPFFLSRALGLDPVWVGAIMSVGPVISAFTGIPAGRIVDSCGAAVTMTAGLLGLAVGAFALAWLPTQLGLAGYIVAIALLTPSYQLFQAANNTAVMKEVAPQQRGVISGMLGLSRNLGLVTGASVMGAVFAAAAGGMNELGMATADATATGLTVTFLVAGMLVLVGLVIVAASRLVAKPAMG